MNVEVLRSGAIEAPPRESSAGSAFILLAVGAISIALVIPRSFGTYALSVLSLLLLIAIIKRYVFAIHISMLFILLFLPVHFWTSLRIWPLSLLVPIIIYALVAVSVPVLRESASWNRMGHMDSNVKGMVITIAIISAVALIGWVLLLKPDLRPYIAQIPEMPLWIYPFAGAGFAIFNAVMEEALFRGIVMEAVDSAVGPGNWSVGIQAIPFAAFHFQTGFPNGITGLVMTFVYGIMLGACRRISRGMLAPLIAHIVADGVIFSILIFFYLHR